MQKIKQLGKLCNKRLPDLFFFIYIIVLIPVLSVFSTNISMDTAIKNISYSFLLGFLLFILSLNFDGKKRIFFLWFIFIISIIPGLLILSYFIIDSTFLINKNFLPIFTTNKQESSEFISMYVNRKTIIGILTYVFIPVIYLVKINKDRLNIARQHLSPPFSFLFFKNKPVTFRYVSLLIVCIVSYFGIEANKNWNHLYAYNFYYTYNKYQSAVRKLNRYTEIRKKSQEFKVYCSLPDNINKTFVILIGESLAKKHLSLYGYPRKTTPGLDSLKSQLLIYKNVISPHTQTNPSLKTILTLADNANEKLFYSRPSIVELFNKAGFHSYWIDNQGIYGNFQSIQGIIAQQAKKLIDLANTEDQKYDEAVIKPLKEILINHTQKNKVIFIHFMGSHFVYNQRYPKSFEHFNNSYPFYKTIPGLLPEQKKNINQYDNSVLYNDYIVSGIINSVNSSSLFSYVLYFPDHGEEVYDFRNFIGHTYPNISKYMCDIPFILWRSEEYKKSVEIMINLDRPYSTEDAIHSISQLSGLVYDDYDNSKSIFSKDFKEKQRTVGEFQYENVPPSK